MELKLITPHKNQKELIKAALDPDYFFIVGIIGRQFGKSVALMNIALYWALQDKGCSIYWVSPTDSQLQKVYTEIIDAVIHTKIIKSKKATKGDTELAFTNGSKISFKSAAAEDSLRGGSVNYMIIDEAAFVKQETIETILLPMLAVRGKKCCFISTPKGKNYLYDYFLKGQDKKKFPTWKSLRYTTYESPFSNKEIIDLAKQSLPPKLFQQEYLAEFVDSSSVFNNVNEVLCLKPLEGPNIGGKYYAGIDVGLISDATVISVIDEGGNLVNYYRLINVEAPKIINEIVRLHELWKFERIMIENNSQGLPIYQFLKKQIWQLDEINTNTKTKPEMINKLIHLFNMKEVKCVKDDYLRIELEAFIFKQGQTGLIRFMAELGFHDDVVMSFAIARYCYDQYNKKRFVTIESGTEYVENNTNEVLEGIVPSWMSLI
jgi:hypothetical protein